MRKGSEPEKKLIGQGSPFTLKGLFFEWPSRSCRLADLFFSPAPFVCVTPTPFFAVLNRSRCRPASDRSGQDPQREGTHEIVGQRKP